MIEHSTRFGGTALIEDGRVCASRTWIDDRHHSQQGFRMLAELLQDQCLDLADVDLFVAGIGPGAFTGLRMSVAALQGMALPGGKRVCGVSSGMALAWEVMIETGAESVLVVGDARRQRCWGRRFMRTGDFLRPDGEWQLCTVEEWGGRIEGGTLLVTPDWERMDGLRRASFPDGVSWCPGSRAPTAGAVGRVAWEQLRRGQPLDPPVPIYLHPAVFVAPSFSS